MAKLSDMVKKTKQGPKTTATKKTAAVQKSGHGIFSKSTEKIAESDLDSETESEEDSDSEDEPAQKAALPILPKKAVVAAARADTTSASETSSSQDEKSSESDDSSDSDSEEGSESDESEESEDEESATKRADVAAAVSRRSATPVAEPTKTVKAATYIPPPGFEILPSAKNGKAKATDFFSTSELDGKQLWYITAPASIPISEIKRVSLLDVQSGKPAITVQGQDYGFVQDKAEEQGKSRIMLPDATGKQYRLGKRTIDQTLHLQQAVKLPGTGKDASKRATAITKKPVRQQPEGLKMRFKPIGFGSGKSGLIGSTSSASSTGSSSDSDDEMEDAQPSFKAPPKLSAASKDASDDTSSSDDEMVDAQEYVKADAKSDTSSSESEAEPEPVKKKSKVSSSKPSKKRKIASKK